MAKHYNWLTQNSKIAKMTGVKTYNWGIPAYQSASGFKTCPNAAACVKGCYATMGAYLFSNVARVFEARLKLSQSPNFVNTICLELKRRNVRRVRIHDSGDFYSEGYLQDWLFIMHANPRVRFYAYTKMYSLLKSINLPLNFTVIYSYGGKEDKLIRPAVDRHSRVFTSLKDLQAEGYADASKDDSVALGGNHRIGLIYHGNKSIENTDWLKVRHDKDKKAA